MKYRISGNITVSVGITVEANSGEEALERAYEKFGGVHDYAGNNGLDKLIGVEGDTEWIEADGMVEFDKVNDYPVDKNGFSIGDKVKFSLFDGELCGTGIIEELDHSIVPYLVKVLESKDLDDDDEYVSAEPYELEHI